MALPRSLRVPATVAVLLLALPLVAILLRVPWADLPRLLASGFVRDALLLSLVCATSAAAICVVLGVPLGFLLARSDGRLAGLLRALVTVPLVLPPVVGGIALLYAFGRNGVVGGPLYDATGVALPFTTAGVIVAETFVALPFLVMSVEGVVRSADPRFAEVAAALGARPWTVLRRVWLPLARNGIVAGTVLAWARALGEFGATITFAGSLQGRTQTLPLAAYAALYGSNQADALVVGLVLIVVAVIVLFALRGRWRGALS
ncbi:MAG TPA: ABC transporter permease [Candidatus Nanopelagicales bacterium]|nr:ABC transporter permease [Candidatus Nanopelagicales bacterium]